MIFYFSGTGNSKYAADRLGETLGQQTASIARIMKDGSFDEVTDETVGIISPVYFFGIPSIVREFISKVSFSGQKRFFTVMTYGGISANASAMLRKELLKKGVEVTHSFEIKMPDNYVAVYRVPSLDVQQRLFEDADKKLIKIQELLEKSTHLKKSKFPDKVMTAISYPFYKTRCSTNRFFVTGKCSGCGKCASVCSIGIIEMANGRPRWNAAKCVNCMACLHRCPEAAIENGKSKKHGRYVNPNVVFDDE